MHSQETRLCLAEEDPSMEAQQPEVLLVVGPALHVCWQGQFGANSLVDKAYILCEDLHPWRPEKEAR